MPRHLLGMLAVAIVLAAASAPDRIYVSKGRRIRFAATVFDPPIPVVPTPDRLNQDSAVNCAIFFQSRLRTGDVEGAAALSVTPERVIDEYAKYRARVGDEVYREQIAKLGAEKLSYRYELAIGDLRALIPEEKPGMAHYARLRGGKYFIEYPDMKAFQELQDLSTLVNAIGDGKLKLAPAR